VNYSDWSRSCKRNTGCNKEKRAGGIPGSSHFISALAITVSVAAAGLATLWLLSSLSALLAVALLMLLVLLHLVFAGTRLITLLALVVLVTRALLVLLLFIAVLILVGSVAIFIFLVSHGLFLSLGVDLFRTIGPHHRSGNLNFIAASADEMLMELRDVTSARGEGTLLDEFRQHAGNFIYDFAREKSKRADLVR